MKLSERMIGRLDVGAVALGLWMGGYTQDVYIPIVATEECIWEISLQFLILLVAAVFFGILLLRKKRR